MPKARNPKSLPNSFDLKSVNKILDVKFLIVSSLQKTPKIPKEIPQKAPENRPPAES